MLATHPNLGCHSLLVLHKLGFDLREQLGNTFEAPLPSRLAQLADEVAGYAEWRDVDGRSPQAGPPGLPATKPFMSLEVPFM
jgi:hypothetical protein